MTLNPRQGFITLALMTLLCTPVQASPPGVPATIDQFIAKLFPNAKHYFWVINNVQPETPNEMIVDLNAFVSVESNGPSLENRYLLIIMQGKILAAQHIPLDSDVDCGKDEEV